jgi:hypothetical protein
MRWNFHPGGQLVSLGKLMKNVSCLVHSMARNNVLFALCEQPSILRKRVCGNSWQPEIQCACYGVQSPA